MSFDGQLPPKTRLLRAAAELLANSAGGAVSTRQITQLAGVTAPTLYHHFGDKEGLFDAVVAAGFEEYVAGERDFARRLLGAGADRRAAPSLEGRGSDRRRALRRCRTGGGLDGCRGHLSQRNSDRLKGRSRLRRGARRNLRPRHRALESDRVDLHRPWFHPSHGAPADRPLR